MCFWSTLGQEMLVFHTLAGWDVMVPEAISSILPFNITMTPGMTVEEIAYMEYVCPVHFAT